MKTKIFILLSLFCSIVKVNAQPIVMTKFSYANSGVDYEFYLRSYFSFGPGPKVKWVVTELSNDTVFIKGIYDHRGHFTASFSESSDTIKYTNTISGVNYFNISSNYITVFGFDTSKIDTFWHVYDSTFYIGETGIKEQSAVKALSVYPNPAQVAISLPIAVNELLVYNTFGQVVMRANRVTAQQPVPVVQLSSGLYFVAVYDEEKNKVGVGKFYKE